MKGQFILFLLGLCLGLLHADEHALLGHDAVYRSSMDRDNNVLYIPNPQDGFSGDYGRVGALKVYARNTGRMMIYIFRKLEGFTYEVVHQSDHFIEEINTQQQFNVSGGIELLRGDVLGIQWFANSVTPFDYKTCLSIYDHLLFIRTGKVASEGASLTFQQAPSGWGPCREYSVQAVINVEIPTTQIICRSGMLRCPGRNEIIKVKEAHFGRKNREDCPKRNEAKISEICGEDFTDRIANKCDGQRDCQITVKDGEYNTDECGPVTTVYMTVAFVCREAEV